MAIYVVSGSYTVADPKAKADSPFGQWDVRAACYSVTAQTADRAVVKVEADLRRRFKSRLGNTKGLSAHKATTIGRTR
jgi:hypothetical protein